MGYGFFAYYGRDFNWTSQCVSIRSGMHPKATDEAREKWVIADPFEHWRNLAGQCSEYGKCQILSAFRHGQAMVRAQLAAERHGAVLPAHPRDTAGHEQ